MNGQLPGQPARRPMYYQDWVKFDPAPCDPVERSGEDYAGPRPIRGLLVLAIEVAADERGGCMAERPYAPPKAYGVS